MVKPYLKSRFAFIYYNKKHVACFTVSGIGVMEIVESYRRVIMVGDIQKCLYSITVAERV